jgi:hypothetical protein
MECLSMMAPNHLSVRIEVQGLQQCERTHLQLLVEMSIQPSEIETCLGDQKLNHKAPY